MSLYNVYIYSPQPCVVIHSHPWSTCLRAGSRNTRVLAILSFGKLSTTHSMAQAANEPHGVMESFIPIAICSSWACVQRARTALPMGNINDPQPCVVANYVIHDLKLE